MSDTPPQKLVEEPESEPEDWLPPLILMRDHDQSWPVYVEAVYTAFRQDFVLAQPRFQGLWVRCRRDPIFDGKEAGFWHCVSEGRLEADREPDIRRCERIAWIRASINGTGRSEVDCWENERNGEKRTLIWCREEFLVVLALRVRERDDFRYYQLVTAYCTVEKHRRIKLRKERDEYRLRQSRNG